MVNTGKAILWSLFILLVSSFLLVWYLDLFDVHSFYGIAIILVEYIIGYAYVSYMWRKDQEDLSEKKNLAYCWKRAGELIQQIPGGVSIEWQSGDGRKSEIRNFYDNQTKRSFRAFYGLLSRTRQPVVVIYDVDLDDIARYNASPPPQMLENPYYEFKPFFNEMAQQASMQRMMGRNRGRKGRGYRSYGGFETVQSYGNSMNQDVDSMADGIVQGDDDDR